MSDPKIAVIARSLGPALIALAAGLATGPLEAATAPAVAASSSAAAPKAAPDAAPPASPHGRPKAAKAASTAAVRVALLDINSASRRQLQQLPGLTAADADRIVAGRPYLSKADLVSAKVLPAGVYLQIKNRIVARQDPRRPPKPPARP